MAEENIKSELPMRGEFFSLATCPFCQSDISEDGNGLRMRVSVHGHADLVPVFGIDDEFLGYELFWSYSEDEKTEDYICYECDKVVISIVKE